MTEFVIFDEEEPKVATPAATQGSVFFDIFDKETTQPQSGVAEFKIFDEEEPSTDTEEAPTVTAGTEAPWAKYKGKSLSDEDFLKDPDLMTVVDRALEFRFGNKNAIAETAIGLAGGATGFFKGKSPEERLEIWNNYQRSFAGGQSVTTLNEVAFLASATPEEKAILGESYMLFDQKGNIFTGDDTWGEMFDGVFDYARAALHDPVTLASLGVGKALAAGGTKAASLALKATAMQAYKQSLKQGATKEVARQAAKAATRSGFMTLGAKTVAKYSSVDFAANVGTDIAYQNVLIDTKAREDYSYAQTGIAALGTLAIPSIIAATKGIEALAGASRKASASLPAGERNVFEAYVDVQRKFGGLGPDAITAAVKQRVDLSQVDVSLRQTFDDFNKSLPNFVPWTQAKVDAGKVLNQNGIALTAGENQSLFWRSFLFGDVAGTKKGFAQALSDAGFIYVPRGNDDKITNFVADAMSWLPDATVKKIVSDFESTVGKTFDGTVDTAEQLSSVFENRQSVFGSGLFDSKKVQDLLSEGGTAGQLMQSLSKQADEDHPEVGRYVLSVWKRLVTSHPSTVGLNIKGWAQLSVLNTTSDIVLGGLKLGEAGVYKMAGKQGAYEAAINASKGSIIGSIKRGYNVLQPNATMEAANSYLMLKPSLYEDVIRTTSGGVDALKILDQYNIDPSTKVGKAAGVTEKLVTGVQTIYGVRLQDEVTKLLSFQSALEQGIMREYGQNYNQFMSRQDAFVEMFSPRFKERVDAWALNRTLRETASKNWSQKSGRGVTLGIAKSIEGISRNAAGGYALPFGSFMNTALATLGDYSGFNAAKYLAARGGDKLGVVSKPLNFAEEEGAELIAKGLVGWGVLGVIYMPDALDKIEEGLSWNQAKRDDGSIADLTYDFPDSYFRMASQAVAHAVRDGEVPEDLRKEMFSIFGGQPFRQLDNAGREVMELTYAVLGGDIDEASRSALTIVSALGSRIVSGVMRPLDPANQAAILMSDDYTAIDRKQASSKFLAESFRYVDQIFGGFEAPAQATTTRGFDVAGQDPGKTLGGVRSSAAPTTIERMLASVGKQPWQAVRWGGDDQVKNTMDGIIGPILEGEATRLLEETPDFFKLPLASREKRLNDITKRSKNLATQLLEYSFTEQNEVVVLKREIAALSKKDVKRAMSYLGFDGDPLALVKEDGGLEKLEMLIFITKNFDELIVK